MGTSRHVTGLIYLLHSNEVAGKNHGHLTALSKPKDVEDSEAAVDRPQLTASSLTSSVIYFRLKMSWIGA